MKGAFVVSRRRDYENEIKSGCFVSIDVNAVPSSINAPVSRTGWKYNGVAINANVETENQVTNWLHAQKNPVSEKRYRA